MTLAVSVLAHQGGWDEMLLIVGPIAVVGGLMWLAKRRVEHAAPDDAASRPSPPHD